MNGLDLTPSAGSIAAFAVGWLAGWFMLCRPRRLAAPMMPRATVSVIVPARDEACSIGQLVRRVLPQLRDGDELIVVDDGSTDGTATVAQAAGAKVVHAPPPPVGWAGKPHACAIGAAQTVGEVLVFLDADVAPDSALLDSLAGEVAARPGVVVSQQPWHAPVGAVEQLSMLFNIAALMGCAAFSALGPRVRSRVAFGAVIAVSRETYTACGGHGARDVRGAILEDIALARSIGRSQLFVGSSRGTTFRMYPAGLRSLVEGWTKGIGIGASATPWWALLGTTAWVASLAGGWLASPWFALASLVQLIVLARVAGRFHPLVILLHPVATALFVVVFGRGLVRRIRRAEVTWKGRALRPDQPTR